MVCALSSPTFASHGAGGPDEFLHSLRQVPRLDVDAKPDETNVCDFLMRHIDRHPDLDAQPLAAAVAADAPLQRKKIPSCCYQMSVFARQSIMQLSRAWLRNLVVILLVSVSAALLGYVFRAKDFVGPVSSSLAVYCPYWLSAVCPLPQQDPIPTWASMACLAIGLTSLATSASVFLPEQDMFQRHRRQGVPVSAYFVARNVTDGLPNVFLPPLFFTAIFFYFEQPVQPFWLLYLILVAAQFTCLGMGYMFSLAVPAAPFFGGVVGILIAIALAGVQPTLRELDDIAVVNYLPAISYARWIVEAIYVAETDVYQGIYNVQVGRDFLHYGSSILIPVLYCLAIGLAVRVIAFILYFIFYPRPK
jgi:hypothetical protein